MNESELREAAKDVLMKNLATAYTEIEYSDYYDDDEKDKVLSYILEYGELMGKAISREFCTM